MDSPTAPAPLSYPGDKKMPELVPCQETPHICTGETACGLYRPLGVYVCLCYHTGTLPVNSVCKRNTVGQFSPVANVSHPQTNATSRNSGIPLHVLKSESGNLEGVGHGLLTDAHQDGGGLEFGALMGILSVVLFLVVVGGVIFWKRKFILKKFNQLSNRQMGLEKSGSGSLFPVERFVVNQTYYDSAPLIPAVPVSSFLAHQITIQAQIGQGCFGKVFKGELNGDAVAVKVAKKEHYGEVMKEMETMAAFNHPNILKLLGIVSTDEPDAPWLLFEFMEFGDLATLLRSSSPHSQRPQETNSRQVRKEELVNMASQIADGMSYLASQHFVHRDLAARNCLVGSNSIVKISDFGLSRDVYTCDYYKLGGSRLLPVRWMAPESILYGRFTLESDIWAYGVLLWEMYTWAKQPFYGHSNQEVVELILEGVLLSPPSVTPPTIAAIMAGCWKSEPKDRLTFTQISAILKHPRKEVDDDDEARYEMPISAKSLEAAGNSSKRNATGS